MSRRYSGFKYRVIKKMYNRAITFRDEATTKEEKEAWEKVVSWLKSFYGVGRVLNKNGTICLELSDADIDKIVFEDEKPLTDKSGD